MPIEIHKFWDYETVHAIWQGGRDGRAAWDTVIRGQRLRVNISDPCYFAGFPPEMSGSDAWVVTASFPSHPVSEYFAPQLLVRKTGVLTLQLIATEHCRHVLAAKQLINVLLPPGFHTRYGCGDFWMCPNGVTSIRDFSSRMKSKRLNRPVSFVALTNLYTELQRTHLGADFNLTVAANLNIKDTPNVRHALATLVGRIHHAST
uniref:Uncharacterized protein n=1 Tax=viral metagenome TaxID=1070528 RepID=A0A6H2A421_9ZZZZ